MDGRVRTAQITIVEDIPVLSFSSERHWRRKVSSLR